MGSRVENEDVAQLLAGAGKALRDINQKMSEGAGFNVFRLCGVDHYETMHSKILAEFLNPKGSHGQGKLFLDLFCEMLGRLGFDGSFSLNVSVSTEFTGYIKGESVGRFDILIEDSSTSSVCVIENKIFASEQPEQLKRYAAWLRRERKGWNQHLIRLIQQKQRRDPLIFDRYPENACRCLSDPWHRSAIR
ncbi:MAG: PD-(D/E)XK nuclease family protein [Erysipelotrichaceae bacterium]|nr:PD-(D/E)XK nuclease family protein [Erysipelotrichaceae bacterium]